MSRRIAAPILALLVVLGLVVGVELVGNYISAGLLPLP